MSGPSDRADRVYHILGVPLRTGSLMPGSENDAQAYRDVGLLRRLQAAGCQAVDDGDVAIPSYLPHHSIPPIRSWPGPRIAWECVSERIAPLLSQPGHVPLLIGCDCSVVVGTTQALLRAAGEDVHLLYVDGDFDDAAARADKGQSAAALAVWLTTHGEPFRGGPPLNPSQVHVIGWTNASDAGADSGGKSSWPLAELRHSGVASTARRMLESIPETAALVLHFDIDALAQREMPAAYFPHQNGLTLAEAHELFGVILQDPRLRIIELTEYASLSDLDQQHVAALVDLLALALASGGGLGNASPERSV
jgi:arginase